MTGVDDEIARRWARSLALVDAARGSGRLSRADEAAVLVRALIFDGVLRPHDRVPQDQVADVLQMSRIPVREGLIVLEREGWLTIEMHRGAFVDSLATSDVRDHYELYGMVYGFAVRRALDRGDAQALHARLQPLLHGLDQLDDAHEFTARAFAFHRAVVDAVGSSRLKSVVRSLGQLVPGDFFAFVPAAIDPERRGLKAVGRAVKRKDGDAAAAEYARMMDRVGEAVLAVLADRGLLQSEER